MVKDWALSSASSSFNRLVLVSGFDLRLDFEDGEVEVVEVNVAVETEDIALVLVPDSNDA